MLLADFQARMRGAIVAGELGGLAPLLTGGRDPMARFEIHRRHYEASLARALTEKFPAMVWLAGSEFVAQAARDFIRATPPVAPCIAEYGEDFPAFVTSRVQGEPLPWLRWVGALEWQLSHAALAVARESLDMAALQAVAPEQLANCTLTLQPGLRYLPAPWPVDELLKLFLSEQAPERFVFEPEDIFLEVRGARGAFSVTRLDAGTFAFRQALARGETIGNAAERALDADASFDAGGGLLQLMSGEFVAAIDDQAQGVLQ